MDAFPAATFGSSEPDENIKNDDDPPPPISSIVVVANNAATATRKVKHQARTKGGGGSTSSSHKKEKSKKKPPAKKPSAKVVAASAAAAVAVDAPKAKRAEYVDHAYTDYAIVGEDDLRMLDENSSLLPAPRSAGEASAREKLEGMSCTFGPMKKNAGGVVQPFPGKLLEVLDRSDLVDGIDWMPHGRAFIVKKPKLFTTNILPRFFKQTKFLSFTRQLNLWGFKRITRGADAGAYYHELFLRDRPYLATRMKRQKIKGTGMKLTPNPDEEPNFYNNWPVMPPLSELRVVPPLPPLPAEKLDAEAGRQTDRASQSMLNALREQQQSGQGMVVQNDKKQVGGGGAAMDRVSENMLNALKYGAAAGGGHHADNMSSFLRPNLNEFSNFSNQTHQYGSINHPNSNMAPVTSSWHGGQRYPGANQGNSYDDLLLAPGVSPLDNASKLRYMGHQSANNGNAWENTGGGGLSQNDPLQDELSAIIANRSQKADHVTSMGNTGMYPPQQLTSDRLLMERLRDLDRAQQVKREQQDMSMLRRARLFDDLASSGAGVASSGAIAGNGIHAPTYAAGPNVSNGVNQGPFDRFSYAPPQQLSTPSMSSQGSTEMASSGTGTNKGGSWPTRQDPFARHGKDPVESSVKDALREANHLEELALGQRAKARSLALAGALQSRFGGGEQQQQLADTVGNETNVAAGAAVDHRPSFGRPFGRRDWD